jgi:hypothetical protein
MPPGAAARVAPGKAVGMLPGVALGARQVCLGFQWDPSSWETVPLLWGSLFELLGDRNVHWNLPAMPGDTPVRRRAAALKTLRGRIESRADVVTAMGYSGSPHCLLSLDELDRELSWGLKNPWGTGLADLMDIRPAILIPRVADLGRAGAWKLYAEYGFRLVGVFPEPHDRPPPAPAGCLPFLKVDAASCVPGSPELRRVRRLLGQPSSVFVLVDLSGSPDPAVLHALLEGPSGLFGGRAAAFTHLPDPAVELPAKPAAALRRLDWSPLSIPRLHSILDDTGALSRKKRKKTEEFDSLLKRLGSSGRDLAQRDGRVAQDGTDPRRQMHLLAHMLGEVSLAGSLFDVHLHGGRFCGVTRQGRDLMPLQAAQSFIRSGRSLWTFRTLSSFSFESERGTGLREELGVDGKDGTRILVEYAFREDSPLLTVSLEARFPGFPPGAQVDEYAPIAIALRTLKKGETAAVDVSAPDGSGTSVEISEESGSLFVPGALHRIRRPDGGWIVLEFASAGRAWGLPSFRVARARGSRFLEANPFGSYLPLPGSALGGMSARYSFRLGLEDA